MKPALLRLASQLLAAPRAEPLEDLVARFAGLQGQDLPGVKYSVAARAKDVSEADVDRALTEGRLVRSSPMRGTLHLVAAKDARWLIALTAPGNLKRAAYRAKQLELDEKTIDRAFAIFEKALHGKQHLTRDELVAALAKGKVSPEGQRAYHLLWQATVRGLISSGAPRGKDQTFTLAEHWLPRGKAPVEPAAELALRYFTSRGPATLKDFTWWSSLSAPAAREALEAAAPKLEHEGELWWSPRLKPAPARHALALPGFDELLLGYQDRSALLDDAFAARWCPGGNGIFLPFFVLDGRVAGLWKKKNVKKAFVFDVQPFGALKTSDRARVLEACAAWTAFSAARSQP